MILGRRHPVQAWWRRARGPARLLALAALLAPASAGALELRLEAWSQAPALGQRGVQALARYLSAALGTPVRGRAASSALAHWERTRGGPRYDIALDGAHFTGYRERRFGFVVLAKLAGATPYVLVTAPGTLATALEDLVGRALAVPPSPGLAASLVRRLYRDPLRAPRYLATRDFGAALRALGDGRAGAAFVPATLLPPGTPLNVVLETEPIPAPALSVAPTLSPTLRRRLARALEDAPAGLLAALGAGALERVAPGVYRKHAALLDGTWGYVGRRPASP